MSINAISPSTLLHCLSAVGTGTDSAIKEATSPKGILEHIINIFTFGGITRANDKFYNQIVDSMIYALSGVNEKDIQNGMCMFLDDINGCKISFISSESTPNHVTVEVQKDHYVESYKIDSQRFLDVCRTLKLRDELGIPQDPVILTDRGKMNLRGASLAHQDLTGKNLSNADLSNADLFRAILIDANMENTDLSNARLIKARLNRVNLSGADLSFSDLLRADLSGTVLKQADLTCASLIEAKVDYDSFISVKKHPGANINKMIIQHTPKIEIWSNFS